MLPLPFFTGGLLILETFSLVNQITSASAISVTQKKYYTATAVAKCVVKGALGV